MKTIYVPALAAALALSTSAFAQGTTEPPARGTGLNQEQGKAAAPEKNSYNLLTINKLTKDLESAASCKPRIRMVIRRS